MRLAIVVSGMALLALGACGKGVTSEKIITKSTSVDASATAPAAPASMPARKAGLWEQKISMPQMTQTTKMCLDAAFDQKMKVWGGAAGKSDCSEQRITPHLGGGWDFHSVCKMGESGTVTSDGSATGDFGSHYKVEVNSVTSGSPMPQANGPHKILIEADYKGPCPADMKPGDMEMPGGMKINMEGGGATVTGAHGGRSYSAADVAQMRAQAKAMAAAMKEKQP